MISVMVSTTFQVRLSPRARAWRPKIFTGHAVRGGKSKAKGKDQGVPPPDEGGDKWDLLIRDLWTQGTDSIHEMHVVNTDAVSYQYKKPRSSWRPLIRIRRRSTSTLVSTRVGTSLPSLPQLTVLSGSRRRRRLNASPAASQWSGRSRINVPVVTWRVEWKEL